MSIGRASGWPGVGLGICIKIKVNFDRARAREDRTGSRPRGQDPLAKDSRRLLYTCLTWRIDLRKTSWDENALLI